MTNNKNIWDSLATPPRHRPGDALNHAPRSGRPRLTDEQREMRDMIARARTETQRMPGLTERQQQILDMLVQGANRTQIANKLKIDVESVTVHMMNMRERLGVPTNAKAVLAWYRHYRVLHPDQGLADKDSTLIANLKAVSTPQRKAA